MVLFMYPPVPKPSLYGLSYCCVTKWHEEEEEQETSANRHGYRSGSSSWHESRCLQPPAVYVLLCLGHRAAFRGQRSCTAQVFSSSGVLRHPARHCSSNPAPLYRGLHCCYPVEESQAKESGLTSGL